MKKKFIVKRIISVDLKRSVKGKPYITIKSISTEGDLLYWFGFYYPPLEKKLRLGLAFFGFSGSISSLLNIDKYERINYFTPPYKTVLAEKTNDFNNYKIIRFNAR